jgi:hypothetical protein
MLKKSCFQGNNHYILWSKCEKYWTPAIYDLYDDFIAVSIFVSTILSYIVIQSACMVLVAGDSKWITYLLFLSFMTPFVNKIFKMRIYVNLISKMVYLNKLKFPLE